jgi:hypothetical protein
MLYKAGDRVRLNSLALSLSYIVSRNSYTNMYEGKLGTVLGYAATGKVAIEFDDIVFTKYTQMLSSHDNGCHGKGKLHYCWYLPESCLSPVETTNNLLLL